MEISNKHVMRPFRIRNIMQVHYYHIQVYQLHMTVVLSTKQVRIMNMTSLGYEYFLLLLSKFTLPNSSSLCRCLIFATFLALCLYCVFLSIPLSSFPNRTDNEPDVFLLLVTSISPCLLYHVYVSRFRFLMMKIIHILYKTN